MFRQFRIFGKLFVCFVLSNIFPEIGRAETICLVELGAILALFRAFENSYWFEIT